MRYGITGDIIFETTFDHVVVKPFRQSTTYKLMVRIYRSQGMMRKGPVFIGESGDEKIDASLIAAYYKTTLPKLDALYAKYGRVLNESDLTVEE